jgi:serine/threonine-protein kinase PknK
MLAIGAIAIVATVIAVVVLVVVVGGGKPRPKPTPSPSPSPVTSAVGPTGFRAEDHGSTVDLFWNDNSGGTASYFIVYRSVDGPQQTVSVPQGRTMEEVTQLDPTKGYCFRLGAVIPQGSGTMTAFADTSVRGCIAASPGTIPSDTAT